MYRHQDRVATTTSPVQNDFDAYEAMLAEHARDKGKRASRRDWKSRRNRERE